jgi:hypothetical protein
VLTDKKSVSANEIPLVLTDKKALVLTEKLMRTLHVSGQKRVQEKFVPLAAKTEKSLATNSIEALR